VDREVPPVGPVPPVEKNCCKKKYAVNRLTVFENEMLTREETG
jgi:hypothetical protein